MASELEVGKVKASDSIGIGVSGNPTEPLHIDSNGVSDIMLSRTTGATSGNLGRIFFGALDSDAHLASVEGYQDGAVDAGGLVFSTEPTGGNRANRLTIDSTGNVKIGTGSLAAVGGGPTLGLVGAAPEITLRDSATGTPYAVMRTNDNGNLILEADSGDNAGSSNIEFRVDGATKAAIASSGIGYFDVGGINLGDTTLSNYKEGTFTGSLTAATPPTSVPTATGNYTRIGNQCHFQIKFNSVDTSGASGQMEITGLPFSAANNNDSNYNPINVIFYNLPYSNSEAIIYRNESKIRFYNVVNGAAWNNYNISAGSGKYLWISGTYTV